MPASSFGDEASSVKKIGLFLSAEAEAGGMFQYSLAMLSALQALPAGEFFLVVAHTSPAWKRRLENGNGSGSFSHSVPVRLRRFTRWLTMVPAVFRTSHERLSRERCSYERWSYEHWSGLLTSCSGWATPMLAEECDLWLFPRQEVWSALFPQPVLASVHDLMHRYEPRFPESSRFGRAHYRDTYLGALCRQAMGILVDSEVGKRHVQQSYGTEPERIFVLPYIPPAYLRETQEDCDFDKRYRLPEKFVFYPAQFWEHKNHLRLIRAIAKLRRETPNICLVMVGGGKNGSTAARKEVEKLGLGGHVRFAGHVPERDMAGFYRRARALVLPTLFGPTNIPPLEAFALGCPVAVSGIYGEPEQVGDAALLFDPYDVESIADSIRRLWADDDLCGQLRSRGRQRSEAWGPAQFAAALHGIIRQLTN
jgi:glycosyltransferase involved in cell wall biosynthesis